MKNNRVFIAFLLTVSVSLCAQNQLTAVKHLANNSSNPRKFVRVENKLFFIATTNQQGDEWWVTDGTETGTQLLKDIVPGSGSGLYYADNLTVNPTAVSEGKFYFTSQQTDGQCAVWQSDGTPNGTVRITQWRLPITELMPYNGQLYIVDNTKKVWILNPSTLGSTQLADLGSMEGRAAFFPHNGKVYFYNRGEVYQTDGTAAGTVRVGYFGSSSELKTLVWRDYLYYYSNEYNAARIVRVKNNDAASAELIYVRGFSNPNPSLILNGVIDIRVKDDKLQILQHINDGAPSVRLLESTDGKNFREISKATIPFILSNFLWIDAKFYGVSRKNTFFFHDFDRAETKEIGGVRNADDYTSLTLKKLDQLILIADETNSVPPKWFNTLESKLMDVSVAPANFGLLPSGIFHSGRLAAGGDTELYKTDFATLKANLVKNIKTTGNDDFELIRVGKKVFFLTRDEATLPASTSLWITDGTIGGTVKLKDIPSVSASKIVSTYQDGANLYLQTQIGSNEHAVWITDGTLEGTRELKRFTGQRTEPMKVIVRENRRMFLHPHVSFIYDVTGKSIIDFKVGGNDNLGIDFRELPNNVVIKVNSTLYSVDFDGKFTVLDASGLPALQSMAGTANKVFYNRFVRFDFSIGEPTIALMVTDGTLAGTREISRSLFGAYSVQSLKTDIIATYASAVTPKRVYETVVINENTLSLRKAAVDIIPREILTVDDMYAILADNGRTFALNPRNASIIELQSVAYSDKVIVHEGELYILGQNCRRINLKTLESSLLLPVGDRYTKPFSFFQDGKDLYVSWDGSSPQTWLIRSKEVRKVGDFVMNQRPLLFNGRKAFMVSKTGYPPIMLYTSDTLATQLTYMRDVEDNGEEGWVVFNNYLIVSSFDVQAGVEPWTTDGTPENSRVLDDLQPAAESSFPSRYAVIDDKRLVGIAEAGALGKQLWALRSPILSVEPASFSNRQYIYPNPASTHVTVVSEVPFQFGTRLSVYNSIGQQIFQQALMINAAQAEISVENLATGTYFIVINDASGKRITHKLWVVR
ncbi:T9SS type A sorting domain-containing protein [Runella sp.]|uniref:T9SS type A sorting domain-containing protein n=1 Tax=Runella sp. TaxID=1960881 RepID=UPI003D0AE4DB